MTTVLAIAAGLVVLAGGAAAVRKAWGAWRKVSAFLDAVIGRPAQFGRDAEPGVLERMQSQERLLSSVHHELHPNSGLSLRDAVDRTEKTLADHIATCSPPVQVNVNSNQQGS